jgi:lysophospholipase L1-like esterase
MKQRSIFAALALMLAAAVAVTPAAAKSPDKADRQPLYLAVGDSWAWGYGATVPGEEGYVPRLADELRESYKCVPAKCADLELLNISQPGATTPSLIANQLPQALEILAARNGDRFPRNDVEVITISIGGNDVTNPILGACVTGPSAGCIATIGSEFAAFRADLDNLLAQLRAAAGDDTRIVIGTYDNPFPTCSLGQLPGLAQLAGVVLEGGPGVPQGLNDVIRDVADEYDVEVAEVYGDLASGDWVGGMDCLHPNSGGYMKVADAFADVLVG